MGYVGWTGTINETRTLETIKALVCPNNPDDARLLPASRLLQDAVELIRQHRFDRY